MKATICMLSWNRTELQQTLFENLKKAGADYELFITDQGTENPQHIEFLKSLNPKYLRLNKYNEGIYRSLNQMMIRSNADRIVVMPDDCIMPNNWLTTMLDVSTRIPDIGILGFETKGHEFPLQGNGLRYYEFDGTLHDKICMYGAIMITRQFIEKVGYYHEGYHPYGFGDADICFRCHLAGLICGYVDGLKYEHIEQQLEDHDYDSIIYVARKNYASISCLGYHRWRVKNYMKIGFYEPPPPLREEMG